MLAGRWAERRPEEAHYVGKRLRSTCHLRREPRTTMDCCNVRTLLLSDCF